MESIVFQGSQPCMEFWCSVRLKAPSFRSTLILILSGTELPHMVSTGIQCSWGIPNALCERGSEEWRTHMLHRSALLMGRLHCPIHLHSQKSKFMDKIIVNFKMASRALNQAQSPSVRGAWWDRTGWASVNLALSFLENVLLHSGHSSVLILCCITPFPPLFPGGHRNRALPPISCLMFKPETWTSFHIFSLPQSPHSITNSYQCSCGSISWLLPSPVSTAATRFFLQPLQ